MKPIGKYKFNLLLVLTFTVLLITGQGLSGQTPPPPPPPPSGGTTNGHGLGGNQGPINAPLGNGTEILILLGLLYSSKKIILKREPAPEV